jgi:hypothetical protein
MWINCQLYAPIALIPAKVEAFVLKIEAESEKPL